MYVDTPLVVGMALWERHIVKNSTYTFADTLISTLPTSGSGSPEVAPPLSTVRRFIPVALLGGGLHRYIVVACFRHRGRGCQSTYSSTLLYSFRASETRSLVSNPPLKVSRHTFTVVRTMVFYQALRNSTLASMSSRNHHRVRSSLSRTATDRKLDGRIQIYIAIQVSSIQVLSWCCGVSVPVPRLARPCLFPKSRSLLMSPHTAMRPPALLLFKQFSSFHSVFSPPTYHTHPPPPPTTTTLKSIMTFLGLCICSRRNAPIPQVQPLLAPSVTPFSRSPARCPLGPTPPLAAPLGVRHDGENDSDNSDNNHEEMIFGPLSWSSSSTSSL
jgi:hypothetical protein